MRDNTPTRNVCLSEINDISREKYQTEGSAEPNFCSDCGLSLVNLGTFCTSRNCETCGKQIFFVRRAENGGIRIEAGEKFHTPPITMSLDPNSGSFFTRYGLEAFLKTIFTNSLAVDNDEFVDSLKKIEKDIDEKLMTLDCIMHCDLETEKGCEEAAKILDAEKFHAHRHDLARSGFIHRCYTAIENGDSLDAANSAQTAAIFRNLSILEDHHLKEILWLGYSCYVDIVRNQSTDTAAAKEIRLVGDVAKKVESLDNSFLKTLVKDGRPIGPRISVSSLEESTLKAIFEGFSASLFYLIYDFFEGGDCFHCLS